MALQPEDVRLGFQDCLLDRFPELAEIRQLRKSDELRDLGFRSERFGDGRNDPLHRTRKILRVFGVDLLPVGLEPVPDEAAACLVLSHCLDDLRSLVVLD